MTSCICSVVSRSYAPFAEVWAASIRRHHPDVDVLLCVIDGTDADVPDTCISVPFDELPFEDVDTLLYRYGRQQLVVASKAPLLRAALSRGYRTALFLDVDIELFSTVDELLDPTGPPVQLTPHLLHPLGSEHAPQDLRVLVSGVYNGGCIAVRSSEQADVVLRWFSERLAHHCIHDIGRGLHYDQTWIDLVPSMFDGIALHRDAGCNVAHWNLAERPLAKVDGAWSTRGAPLRFFHYSGFDPRDPEQPTRYRPEVRMEEFGEAAELFETYAARLVAAGALDAMRLDNGLASFANRGRINRDLRRLVQHGLVDVSGLDPRTTRVEQVVDRLSERDRGIEAVWLGIWALRPDLQRTYPDPRDRDRDGFRTWIADSAPREHEELASLISDGSSRRRQPDS